MGASDRQTILAPGDTLGCYRIVSFLGQGGFGVTYVARDTMLDIQVAIKEYMPERIAERVSSGKVQARRVQDNELFRKGLASFLKEARTLARFNHPNIVRVMSVFELHGTAYMVMEYERGHDLKVIFNRREYINETLLKTIIGPVLDGLEEVHRHGFIHRDIKPANILVRDNGTPVLLDFGSARLTVGNDSEALTAMVTAGFAPLEQYSGLDDQQGPWTDVYALGAVLYYAVTGAAPPDSTLRGAAVLNEKPDPYLPLTQLSPEGYSSVFCRAVDWALQFRVSARPQSLRQWRSRLFNDESLSAESTAEPVSAVEFDTTEPIQGTGPVQRPDSSEDRTVVRQRSTESLTAQQNRQASANHLTLDDTYEFEPVGDVFPDDDPTVNDTSQFATEGPRRSAKSQSYLLMGIAAFVLVGGVSVAGFKRWQASVLVDESTVASAALEQPQPAVTREALPAQTTDENTVLPDTAVAPPLMSTTQDPGVAIAEIQQTAEEAEAEQKALQRAARLEADREVQRAEALRQAELQKAREDELIAEQKRVADAREKAQREAGQRQAEIARERARVTAAAELEAERVAQNSVPSNNQSNVSPAARISASDFSDVLSRFNALSKAVEQRDSVAMKEITIQSDRKYAYFDYVFRTFDKVEVDLKNISASRQDQTIRATLSVERMIRSNGDIAIPPDEFRNIPLYSVKETTWSAIHW